MTLAVVSLVFKTFLTKRKLWAGGFRSKSKPVKLGSFKTFLPISVFLWVDVHLSLPLLIFF